MGSEWIETTLGNVIELKRGYDLPSQDRKPGSVPVVTSSGINDYHAEAKVAGPGVVTGRYGTLGSVYYIKEDFWPHNTTLYVRDFKGSNPRFISYFLRTLQFLSYSDKAAVPGINRNHLHEAIVRIPPLPEQRAIAAVLGALDDKIELNRRMNGTLEGLARALFRAWFVEFEPVRAKMEGRPTGLAAEIEALFPEALVVGEDGGERPRGWEVASLPEFVEINPSRTLRVGTNAPYLDMSNMPTETARATGFRERGFSSGMRFINGDTLVARITPCLENGKTCFVDFLEEGTVGWGSTEYIVLHPRAGLPDEFAYFLARTERFREFAISNMTGTSGRQRVPVSVLEHFMFPVPTIPIAERFGQIARHTLLKMKANDEQSATLAALRDELLPRLMRGEVRVSNLENVFGVV